MPLFHRPQEAASPARAAVETARSVANARAVLVAEGTRRRRRLRVVRALQIGVSSGALAYLVAHGFSDMPMVFAIVSLMGVLESTAPRRQKRAVASLLDAPQLSDLPWLIEATDYADTKIRPALDEAIRRLLEALRLDDAAYLPEGARKVLRRWFLGSRKDPALLRAALQALVTVGDRKAMASARDISRRKPLVPEDRDLIAYACSVIEAPVPVFPEPPQSLEEARALVAAGNVRNRKHLLGFSAVALGVPALAGILAVIFLVDLSGGFWLAEAVLTATLLTPFVAAAITLFRMRNSGLPLGLEYHQAVRMLADHGDRSDLDALRAAPPLPHGGEAIKARGIARITAGENA